MWKVQPLAIISDGHGMYRVQCDSDNGNVEFAFTVSAESDSQSPSISHDKLFDFLSINDYGGHLLEQSIFNFDSIVRSGIKLDNGNEKLFPVSLMLKEPNAEGNAQYELVCQSDARKSDHALTLSKMDYFYVLKSEHDSWRGRWEDPAQSYRFFLTPQGDNETKELMECIVRFNEARDYKVDPDKLRAFGD